MVAPIERGFVIVSGPPGGGKTTIAVPLAKALGLPLLCKDLIKETLHDSLQAIGEPYAWSRTLGGASFELLWVLAPACPAAVLEANFHPSSAYERGRLSALPGPLVEVHCRCPSALAAKRYRDRHAAGERHPTHVIGEVTLAMQQEFEAPMDVGTVIEVDTTAPVDIAVLAAAVRAALSALNQTT